MKGDATRGSEDTSEYLPPTADTKVSAKLIVVSEYFDRSRNPADGNFPASFLEITAAKKILHHVVVQLPIFDLRMRLL